MGPILGGVARLKYTAATTSVTTTGTSLTAYMNNALIAAQAPVNNQFTIANTGHPGAFISTLRGERVSIIEPTFQAGKVNVLTMEAANNSIWNDSYTAAQAWTEMATFISELKAGKPWKIVLLTEMVRFWSADSQASINYRNGQMDAYNAYIRGNYRAMGAVALCDIRAPGSRYNLPDYTAASFAAVADLFDVAGDGAGNYVHRSAAGNAYVAAMIAQSLIRVSAR